MRKIKLVKGKSLVVPLTVDKNLVLPLTTDAYEIVIEEEDPGK